MHEYRVRFCVNSGATVECGGDSEKVDLHRLANPTRAFGEGLTFIQDPALRACLEQDVDLYGTVGEVTFVFCWGQQIQSLEGLEQFSSITNLWLPGNQISDLSPLVDLLQLSYVELSSNQIASAQLENLAGSISRNYSVINVSSNLLSGSIDAINGNASTGGPLLPPTVNTLIAADNDISEVPDLTGIEVLDLTGNLVAEDNAMAGGVGQSSLRSLNLTSNPIQCPSDIQPSIGVPGCSSFFSGFAGFPQLEELIISDVGLTNVGFLDSGSFAALKKLDVSSNSRLFDLSGLENVTELQELNLSGTQVTHHAGTPPSVASKIIDPVGLPLVSSLTSLALYEAESLVSLDGISTYPALSSLAVSESLIAQCEYIGFSPGLNGTSADDQCETFEFLRDFASEARIIGLHMSGNGVHFGQAIHDYVESNPDFTPSFEYFFDLRGESTLDCTFVPEEGGGSTFSVSDAKEAGPDVIYPWYPSDCLPPSPELTDVFVEENLTSISVNWAESPSERSLDSYEIKVTTDQGSTVHEVLAPATSSLLSGFDLSQGATLLEIEIRACRLDASGSICSPPRMHLQALYPLMTPSVESVVRSTTGAGTTADVSWSYPDIPARSQEGFFFELRPVINGVGTVLSGMGYLQRQLLGLDVSAYPGEMAKLFACSNRSGSIECSAPTLVSLREGVGDASISGVSSLTADSHGDPNDGDVLLSWAHPEHGQSGLYYRVRELSRGNVRTEYVIEENEFISRKYELPTGSGSGPLVEYQVVPCRSGSSGEICSEVAESIEAFESITEQITLNSPSAPPSGSDTPQTDVCWFDYQNGQARLRWSYVSQYPDGQVEFDVPTHFNIEYRNSFSQWRPSPDSSNPTEIGFDAPHVVAIDSGGEIEFLHYWESTPQWVMRWTPPSFASASGSRHTGLGLSHLRRRRPNEAYNSRHRSRKELIPDLSGQPSWQAGFQSTGQTSEVR